MRTEGPIHVARRDARVACFAIAIFLAVTSPSSAASNEPGQAAFDQYCGSCHEIGIGARNGEGPQLNGITGRPAATRSGYPFSTALSRSAIVWTAKSLDTFIANPRGAVPGTRMAVPGVGSDSERRAIVTYIGGFQADGKAAP